MAMKKLWFRLGVEVDVAEEIYDKIINGDNEALVEHIKANGVDTDGDSYIPVLDEDGEYTGDDVELGIPRIKLVREL